MGSRDLYLCDLLLSCPSDIFVLHSFHIELTDIVMRSTDSGVSSVRLQWWSDILSGVRSDDITGSVLLGILLDESHSLSSYRSVLSRKSSAHILDLDSSGIETYSLFEDWCGHTRSVIFHCGCQLLGGSSLPQGLLSDVSGHAGIVWGVVWTLQNLHFFRSRHKVFIPEELLSSHDLDISQFCEQWDSRHLSCIHSFLDYAQTHLVSSFKSLDSLPSHPSKRVFLYLHLLSLYLPRLRSRASILANSSVNIWQPLKQFSLYRASRLPRYN